MQRSSGVSDALRRTLASAGLLAALAFSACGKAHDTVPAGRPAERQVLYYRHPMNPEVTSPVPAKDDMGMSYVPVYADEATAGSSQTPGLATVETTAAGVRIAGVLTAPAVRERLTRSTRTIGTVVADERRVRRVTTKIAGWVEKLHVNYTGQAVHAGDPVLAIYSPELLASQEEYLRAREASARFAASSIPEVRRGAADLVASARRRLELFDVPPSFLAALERTGRAQRTVTLLAPASGYVSAKQVVEGMAISPGLELFTLTDLSRVWIEAQFYENEAALLRPGQRAEVRLPYDPGRAMPAEIAFLAPTLASESRTLQARLELANPRGELRPGMFVDVTADLESAEGVTVPDDAVIDTGSRRLVFVERAPGTFEPREVEIGIRSSGRAVVLSGVAAGENVATRANFLLDSESRLRAALQTTTPAMQGAKNGGKDGVRRAP